MKFPSIQYQQKKKHCHPPYQLRARILVIQLLGSKMIFDPTTPGHSPAVGHQLLVIQLLGTKMIFDPTHSTWEQPRRWTSDIVDSVTTKFRRKGITCQYFVPLS
ncbi:hypothetical protein QUC31_016280 [Theobroma cacao]